MDEDKKEETTETPQVETSVEGESTGETTEAPQA